MSTKPLSGTSATASSPATFGQDAGYDHLRLQPGFYAPRRPSPTLLVMSGFLEYVTDPESFFQSLSRSVKGTRTVFSWAHLPAEREARLRHGWISPLVVDPTNPAFFLRHFEGLRRVAVWNGQGVYEGLLA